jgi:cell division protein FtsQ
LDEFGRKMQISDNYTPKLVVATGEISAKNHIGIFEFIKLINNSDFWSAQITQIHFEHNNILLITRVGSQKINIGSFKNISEKLDNLYQFYIVAMPLKGWQNYSNINLNFNNQIVCVRK